MTDITNKMEELEIFWIHNFSLLDDNEVFHYYNDFEVNIDKTLKLSQLRDLTMLLYEKEHADNEYIEEDKKTFNGYIKELWDLDIKVIFDIWFKMEDEEYNQENIVKLNSIRVYDDNINKNIPSKLIWFLKECWYWKCSLTDIDYVIDSKAKEYERIFKILWIKSLWGIIEENYKLYEIVFNYGKQRILLFIPKEDYNKKMIEEIKEWIIWMIGKIEE